MLALHKLNIQKKLLFILLGISAVSMLMAAMVLIGYESHSSRLQQVHEMNLISQIIADRSTAALVFGDKDAAMENLGILAAQSFITYACIRNEYDELFAEYKRNPDDNITCNRNSNTGDIDTDISLVSYQDISQDGKYLGFIHIRSDLSNIFGHILQEIMVLITVFSAAMAFSYFTAKKLIKQISGPIINLASITRSIADSEDFTLRARKYSDDEIGDLVDSFNDMLKHIQYRDGALQKEKLRVEYAAQEARNAAQESRKYAEDTWQSNLKLEKEIDIRRKVEHKLKELNDNLEQRVNERTMELKDLNQRIGEIARNAGMAEVASGVLHNVGNVLNSVNVSSSVIRELLRKSKSGNLDRVAELFRENQANLGDYIINDPKGSRLPEFISLLAQQLQQEREQLYKELDVLANNIDHIKNVISMQQSYAGSYGILEQVAVSDLLEDALRINSEGMDRYGIKVERQYISSPVINIDKHKILQILINLISNAKHALIDSKSENRKLILKVSEMPGTVNIEVIDNGIGIAEADMAHLFEYGFKKRKGGHGYGLHHSALIANELDGQITVHSDGPGLGASFRLSVPLNAKSQAPGNTHE